VPFVLLGYDGYFVIFAGVFVIGSLILVAMTLRVDEKRQRGGEHGKFSFSSMHVKDKLTLDSFLQATNTNNRAAAIGCCVMKRTVSNFEHIMFFTLFCCPLIRAAKVLLLFCLLSVVSFVVGDSAHYFLLHALTLSFVTLFCQIIV
jgi:hypothetical protein